MKPSFLFHLLVPSASVIKRAYLNWKFYTYRWSVKLNCWDHLWRWKSPFMRPIYNYKRKWIPFKSKTPSNVRYLDVKCIWLLLYRLKNRNLPRLCVCVRVCRKMDQLHQENLELVRKLAAQEEAFSYSDRQLDQRSTECKALSRQLEAALSDVKQQVQLLLLELKSLSLHMLAPPNKKYYKACSVFLWRQLFLVCNCPPACCKM